MVWQKILGRVSGNAKRQNRKLKQRRLRLEKMERREVLASNLGAIAGVAFIDQAGDGSSAGDPPVLVDGAGDLVAPGTPGAQGITVSLFSDNDGNGIFNPGPGLDQLVGTDITQVADGSYRFDGLASGTFFIEQQTVPQLNTPALLTVQVTNEGGVRVQAIDTYDTATAAVTATSGNPIVDSFTDTSALGDAIGGERDVQVTHAAGTSDVELEIVAGGDMTISTGTGTSGNALLQYDGVDGVITLNATGLGGVSLSGGDAASGLEVSVAGDNPGGSIDISIYTNATDFSTANVVIPDTAGAFQTIFVPFSTFTPDVGGSGADFTNVGAIEAMINTTANLDVGVRIIETLRPEVVTTDLANILPITLGGQIFLDNSSVGQNNGIREGTEAGVPGVTVELYQLAGPTDVVDPTNTALTSTTTIAGGAYSFPGLDPGHYAVVVPSNQFQTAGQPLFGHAASTGGTITDPDDNLDNDNEGTTLPSGDVISGTITLVSDDEPINDDDTDPNTNTTLDFGFFPQIDLLVTKSVNAAASNIIAGGNVVFDIVVQNAGPLDATDVRIEDIFPTGLTFTGTQNPSGAFTTNVNGQTVTVLLGPDTVDPTDRTLVAGTTATFQLTANIGANQTADLINTATVSGDEVDTDPANNSSSAPLDLIESDLRIEKVDLTDPVNAGDQLTYQITVTNDGPDDAAGVIVTDPLPVGVSFVSGNVGGNPALVSFDAGTRTVTATVGALSATAGSNTSIITLVVDVATNASSPLNNTATVTANPNTDPDTSPTSNEDSEDTTVVRQVDVGVTKTVNGTPVAGQTVTYVVTVNNAGPSAARGISVLDTLDSQLTLVPGSFDPGTSGVTLSQTGQVLTFTVGTLDAPGGAGPEPDSVTFEFDVAIASSATGDIRNTADVSTTDNDTNATNDSGFVDISVQQEVDLILTKTVDLATARPGVDQLVYTFVVSHDTDSCSDASNVVITDMIPAGTTGAVITEVDPADSTDFSSNTVTVVYNTIPVGETRTFRVTVDINEDATGTVENDATVTSNGTDIDPTNNTSQPLATTTLTPEFDVEVQKRVNNATPGPTDTVVYTVDLINSGPSTAADVILTDTIPTGLTFVSGTLLGQAGVVNGSNVVFPAVDVSSGQTVSATLNFTVDTTASGQITNTASVPDMTADGETNAANNMGSADITVTSRADLGVTKMVSMSDAQAGSSLTYTMTVTNAGPSQATNVVATDTLPAGVTFVSGTGRNGEALTATGNTVTINGGTLDSGGSFDITINVTVDAGATGTLTNSIIVSSDTNDDNSTNDSASASTDIDPRTSTISGVVYVDQNNNGIQEAGENGISGVTITLSGSDTLGNAVNATTTTDTNGNYNFGNLAAGTYTVTETQPPGFRDGIESTGTGANASAADNVFTQLGLGVDTDAQAFNFGERNERLSKRRFLASS